MTTRYEAMEAALNRAHTALIGYLPAHRNAITDAAIQVARTALAMPEDEPAAFVDVVDSYEGPYNFHGQSLLPVGLHSLYTSPQPAPSVLDIKTLVDRFLTWKLPDTFAPDAGISFKAPDERWWPTGTNLFMATEAEEMLRHVLAAAPEQRPLAAKPTGVHSIEDN